MKKNIEKPSAEAKALSLFLMAYKTTSPPHKVQAKRINKLWDLVKTDKLSQDDYMEEVENTLKSYGGYSEVVEKTVQFYIEKTGEWRSMGNDKYGLDAKEVADRILEEK